MFDKTLKLKCNCGKEYKHQQSLNRHKITCDYKESENQIINEEGNEDKEDYKKLVMKLIIENQEIKNIYANVGENINIDKGYIIIERHVKERKKKI